MTTEGESDNVETTTTTRNTRKRRSNASLNTLLINSDDENSLSESSDESSEDEWENTRKKTKKCKRGPVRTLKKVLAEKTKNLKIKFNRVSTSLDIPSKNTDQDATKPDTTTKTESTNSLEAEERKPIVTFMCDIIEKVVTVSEENEIGDSESKVAALGGVERGGDDMLKCDSSIKTEQIDPDAKIKEEHVDHISESTITKNMKHDKDQDADADTVILLSDDDDDVPNDPHTVVLNCSILQKYASPILTGSESVPVSPTTPKIRVRSLEQISNAPSPTSDITNAPNTPYNNSNIPSSNTAGIPFTSSPAGTFGTHVNPPMITSIPTNPAPVISSPRPRITRGRPRGAQQSTRGRIRTPNPSYKPRRSPDVRSITARTSRGRPSSTYSPQSRVTTPPRLDSISLKNISPGGTVIRNGSDSVTITPRKKSPERSVQRRLFKAEVEGIISARDTGYVVNLANGKFLPLSEVQVEKLREQNHGILPTRLRIPVPSDVAASIETRIVIDD